MFAKEKECSRNGYTHNEPNDENALLKKIQTPQLRGRIQNRSARQQTTRPAERHQPRKHEAHQTTDGADIKPTSISHLFVELNKGGIGSEPLLHIDKFTIEFRPFGHDFVGS